MIILTSCMIAAEDPNAPIYWVLLIACLITAAIVLYFTSRPTNESRQINVHIHSNTQPSEVPEHILLRSPFVQKFNRHFPIIKKALDEYPNVSELSYLRDNELRFFMLMISFVCSGDAQLKDVAALRFYLSKYIPDSMDTARSNLYMDFIDKDAPAIAEWCNPTYREMFSDSQSPIVRCITAFGDLLVNQDRARDYYNATPVFPAYKAYKFEDYYLDRIVPLLIEYSKEFSSPIQLNAQ